MKRKYDPIQDPASAWAEDVVDGRVVSGHLMRLACERHLRDIIDGPKRGLHWRPEKAEHALAFFPACLSVTAGAKVGEPFNLPSWTALGVGSIYGWMRANGRRRYRHVWWEFGKGQVKTPTMAAIGLYTMGWCDIPRSEVYAIAKDRNQANVLFGDAVAMCQAPIPGRDDETLESGGKVLIRGTGQMAWMIEHPETGSLFRALAGDERVSGPRPSLVIGDEIHEWRTGGPIETWQAAIAKMPGDAMMILGTNTPAADQPVGTEYSEVYQEILRGEAKDDTAFALIARTDPDDDPMNDESVWLKSLPCLDITFPIENVRGEVEASKHRMAKALATKRLYFGIPVGVAEYWIDLDAWESVQGIVDLNEFRGRRCWLSLDLSRKNDLTALGIGFEGDDGKLHAAVRYWRPSEKIAEAAKSDHGQYVEWSQPTDDPRGPILNAIPGSTVEYAFVAEEVRRICSEFDVEMMAIDPAFNTDFRKACENMNFDVWIWTPDNDYGSGLKMVIHGQGVQGMNSEKMLWMPRSLGQLEDRILKREIVIDDSPLTKWCSGNAAIRPDRQGNRYFEKKRQRGRIDGLTVLAMLAGAAESELGGQVTSEVQLFFA